MNTLRDHHFDTVQAVAIGGCPNHCPYCIGRQNLQTGGIEALNLAQPESEEKLARALAYTREILGCGSLTLTGRIADPLASPKYLEVLGRALKRSDETFPQIQVQSSGITWSQTKLDTLKDLGVSVFALSTTDMFSSANNARINRTPERLAVDLDQLAKAIKLSDFTLRLCVNLSDIYNDTSYANMFARAQELQANQITFRTLQVSGAPDSPESQWIAGHQYADPDLVGLTTFAKQAGREIGPLSDGFVAYDVGSVSVAVDPNCLAREGDNTYAKNYVILDQDGELRTSWAEADKDSSRIEMNDKEE